MVSGILVETVPRPAPTAGSSKMLVTTVPGPDAFWLVQAPDTPDTQGKQILKNKKVARRI